ncbi:MAG: hypothetical protein HY914_16000 [Desulfomonile tiedjei]|nr:hypothetical protein [Desulfomonile tiedjei]
MECTVESRTDRALDAKRPNRVKVCLMLSLVAVLMASAPAFALWLPWAGEEDKIKKVVSDVWRGLVSNDQALLSKNLAGEQIQWFVDNHQNAVKRLGIQSYQCLFQTVTLDPAQGATAQVTYETVATLEDGSRLVSKIVSTVGKVNGEWKLLADVDAMIDRMVKDRLKQAEEEAESEVRFGPLPGSRPDFRRPAATGGGGLR